MNSKRMMNLNKLIFCYLNTLILIISSTTVLSQQTTQSGSLMIICRDSFDISEHDITCGMNRRVNITKSYVDFIPQSTDIESVSCETLTPSQISKKIDITSKMKNYCDSFEAPLCDFRKSVTENKNLTLFNDKKYSYFLTETDYKIPLRVRVFFECRNQDTASTSTTTTVDSGITTTKGTTTESSQFTTATTTTTTTTNTDTSTTTTTSTTQGLSTSTSYTNANLSTTIARATANDSIIMIILIVIGVVLLLVIIALILFLVFKCRKMAIYKQNMIDEAVMNTTPPSDNQSHSETPIVVRRNSHQQVPDFYNINKSVTPRSIKNMTKKVDIDTPEPYTTIIKMVQKQ